MAPLAVDRGELRHGAPDLGRSVQLVAQEALIERRVVDHNQGVMDSGDDARAQFFELRRICDILRGDAVDRLGTGPAAMPLGAHQTVEQHPAGVVQDADLEDLVGTGIEPCGLEVNEDGAHRSALSGCGLAWLEA